MSAYCLEESLKASPKSAAVSSSVALSWRHFPACAEKAQAAGWRRGRGRRMDAILLNKGEDKLKSENQAVIWCIGWRADGWWFKWMIGSPGTERERAYACVCVCRLDHCYDCTGPQDTADNRSLITSTFIPTSASSSLPASISALLTFLQCALPLHQSIRCHPHSHLYVFFFCLSSPSLTTSRSPRATHYIMF